MKTLILLICIAGIFVIPSCGGAENKVDKEDTLKKKDSLQIPDTTQQAPVEKVTLDEPKAAPPVKSNPDGKRGIQDSNRGKNDILANIDKHLVCSIEGGALSISNTLGDIEFQKALVEVNVLKEDGSILRSDYYTIINLDPGETKLTKLTSTNLSAKMAAHVIKVKSDQLTNGEMILVGSRYSPQ